MNKVCLFGRLCADPNVREFGDDKLADFTLAVDRGLSKEAKEKAKQTADLIRCKAWGPKAELIEKYLKKGDQLAPTGKIQTGSYYDTRLSPLAKLLYGEITCLCQKEGFYWATNAYFERLYRKSERQIIRIINQLVEYGYISRIMEYDEKTKQVKKRLLRLGGTEKKNIFMTKMSVPLLTKIQ